MTPATCWTCRFRASMDNWISSVLHRPSSTILEDRTSVLAAQEDQFLATCTIMPRPGRLSIHARSLYRGRRIPGGSEANSGFQPYFLLRQPLDRSVSVPGTVLGGRVIT